jgi:hypothetical protein
MRERAFLFSLNGGEVSPLAMGRVDLSRMRISGEAYLNLIPRVIGPVQARPGTGHLGSTDGDGAARMLPFIFSATDTALVECSDAKLRVWVDDALISRASVSTVVTNGDFSSDTGWTVTNTGTADSDIDGLNANALTLRTPGRGDTTLAKRSDSVAGGDQGVEHAIEITVDRGPVRFRCGSTDGGQEYILEIELAEGFHSLAFTPTSGTYYIQFSCESEAERIVSNVAIASSGVMEITAPWSAAQLPNMRYDQSGDVIYLTCSCGTLQPQKIVRYGVTSWSLVPYYFTDGPLRGKTADLTLTPSARTGNGTLTASKAFFDAGHVGSVFRISHEQTTVSATLTGADRYTDTIRISGSSRYDIDSDGSDENTAERDVVITITGTWSGILSLQISDDDGATWRRVQGYQTNQAGITRTPGSANTVVLCRLGFNSDDYTSGEAVVNIVHSGGGGGDGYVLITGVNSTTEAEYEVIERLHSADVAVDWSEGKFSALRGWPTAIGLFDGRLWWGGQDQIAGSVSDGFESFDLNVDGDSGPIIRSIAIGPVNAVRWILGLSRLCIGTSGSEPVGRSSSFDEPMTPTNFSLKDASTQGSANVQAVKVDKRAVYVQRSGKRAYQLNYSIDNQDYGSAEITRYHPTVLEAGVKVVAVQRQPDTRVLMVLDDGTAACVVYEPDEDVLAWYRLETDGLFEDVSVLPNTDDDDVYFIVNRTIDGATKRYVEKLAYDTQAQGGSTNYMADSYVTATLSSSTTMSGLDHLEGEDVVVWVNGGAIMNGDVPQTFTVSSGSISLGGTYSGLAVAGLQYEWQWQSAKLAYGVQDGNPISRKKKISLLAPVLYKTHIRGIKYGYDFTNMTYLPLVSDATGATEDTSKVFDSYDPTHQALDGVWDTDARVCLAGVAPLPCTILALSMVVDAN